MTSKVLLGTTLAALFAVSMVGIAFAGESWQGVVESDIESKNKDTSTLTLTATDTIPKNTAVLAGFAWLYDDGPNTAYAITTHEGVRDSLQNPDGWHSHNVVLSDVPTKGNSGKVIDTDGVISSACIAQITDAPNSGVSLSDESVSVQVKNSDLTGTIPGGAAAFSIVVDADCPITSPTTEIVEGGLPLAIVIEG